MEQQVKIDIWKAKAALLYIEQLHAPLESGQSFAEAAYDNIDGDIEDFSPQDAVDEEIDAMRSSM